MIDSYTGAVTVGSSVVALDYETIPDHQLVFEVRARDDAGLSHVTQVVIAIQDVPEPPTSISLSATSIDEGTFSCIFALGPCVAGSGVDTTPVDPNIWMRSFAKRTQSIMRIPESKHTLSKVSHSHCYPCLMRLPFAVTDLVSSDE